MTETISLELAKEIADSEKKCEDCNHYFDYYPDGWMCKICLRGKWVQDNYEDEQIKQKGVTE